MPGISALTIETPRLLLRPPQLEDLDGWSALMADAEAERFIGGPRDRHDAWIELMAVAGAWSLQGFCFFSVIEKSSGRWIGRLGPLMPEGWPGPEMAWALVRDVWHQGYATEGVTAAIDWVFEHLAWTEIIHIIDPANTASEALARKLGSHNRGPGQRPALERGKQVNIWGQTRAEWMARATGHTAICK